MPKGNPGQLRGAHPAPGSVFGRLTVTGAPYRDASRTVVEALCSCGAVAVVQTKHLRSGATSSCGCLQRERAAEAHYTGLTGTRRTTFWRELIFSGINDCEMCGRSLVGVKACVDHVHTCTSHNWRTSACYQCIRGLVCSRCNYAIGVFDEYDYPDRYRHWKYRRPLKDHLWDDFLEGARREMAAIEGGALRANIPAKCGLTC